MAIDKNLIDVIGLASSTTNLDDYIKNVAGMYFKDNDAKRIEFQEIMQNLRNGQESTRKDELSYLAKNFLLIALSPDDPFIHKINI